jgi:serine/threonine-protein kinase
MRVQSIESPTPRLIRLGQGGFGSTYRLSGGRGEPVLVAKLMPEAGLRARVSARLEREMGTIAALSHHEDMVTVVGWGEKAGRWFVAFEEAAGGSLAQLVDAGVALDWRTVVRLGVRLARVLELAHDLGVLHRDIKPANILLTDDGRPLLTDLGLGTLACSFSLDGRAAAESLAVAAPEASRTINLTARSDVYALAATLRLLLGGRVSGGRRAESPAPLLALLDAATARDAAARHPTMRALRADLELLDAKHRRPLRITSPRRLSA